MRYVVIVREPLPEDLTTAALRLAEGFDLPSERATRLLQRAPGPVTRPVAEREARKVATVLQAAGLNVEVRQESVDGPVMEWILPDAPGAPVGAAATDLDAEPVAEPVAEPTPEPVAEPVAEPTPEPAAGPVVDTGIDRVVEPPAEPPSELPGGPVVAPPVAPARAEPGARRTDPGLRERDPKKSYVPGMTVTAPPRDPMKTTLERDPPRLERGGLRRRVASAATLPALLTLLVTLLALAATLLPLLRAEEARRAAGAADAVAATLEGLSSGLPLTAPLMRAQLSRVAERTAARLPAQGIDFLVVLDAEGNAQLAWYRGQVGEQSLPTGVREALAARLRQPPDPALPESWLDSLRASGNNVLAMVGLAEVEPVVALARVERAGGAAGAVLAGSEGRLLRADVGRALLSALLVGLIPVLFGILAAQSLTRGLRDAITYLLRATDRISHGDFERPVELARDDELGQIAKAVERMRISLREAMERLRRR